MSVLGTSMRFSEVRSRNEQFATKPKRWSIYFCQNRSIRALFLWSSGFCSITALAHTCFSTSVPTSCDFVGRIRYTVNPERPAFGCVHAVAYDTIREWNFSFTILPCYSYLFPLSLFGWLKFYAMINTYLHKLYVTGATLHGAALSNYQTSRFLLLLQ